MLVLAGEWYGSMSGSYPEDSRSIREPASNKSQSNIG